PAQDAVRIGQQVELAFPPVTISAFEPGGAVPSDRADEPQPEAPDGAPAAPDDEPAAPDAPPGPPDAPPDAPLGAPLSARGAGPARLRNLFFGLFGPMGPLPIHLTEYARDRARNHDDPTMIAFADIFHHRMTSLLYRAWASAEPAPSFDRMGDDPFGDKVAAFAGLMEPAFRGRDAMPDSAKLYFAGLMGGGPRNEAGLLAIVSAFFRIPCTIESFVGSWLELEAEDRWQLGTPARLGGSTSLGGRVWSRQAKFRLRLGPLQMEDYRRLLPGGDSLARLVAIVRGYLGDALDWDVNLVLARREAPPTRLGVSGQLGWTTWIGAGASEREADDLTFNPAAAAQARPGAGRAEEA
ncbi:MAG: type VI secretion system baseplate subunit TssG, partial [Pseudomonadota bacterium]